MQELLWLVPGPLHKLRKMRDLPAPEVMPLVDLTEHVSSPSGRRGYACPHRNVCSMSLLKAILHEGLSMSHKPTIWAHIHLPTVSAHGSCGPLSFQPNPEPLEQADGAESWNTAAHTPQASLTPKTRGP